VAFEVPAEGAIDEIPGCGSTPFKIRGRVDRVDRHRDTHALRIIDYKLKIGKSITPEDRHLIQSAARGYRLQPPFYARLHLRNGRFFIMPDAYCKTCEYRVACRREHMPTSWRSARAREGKALAALRNLRVDQ
jgi:ATP-dependent helicase/nuclease subunit B